MLASEEMPRQMETRHAALPGDFAMWIFIFAELAMFGLFFMVFAITRTMDYTVFESSQRTLNRALGAIDTAVLITGSYAVVRAVQAIRRDAARACVHWLGLAIGLGGIFLALKLYEFHQDVARGITLSTNTFYMFYLSLTFLHFMHVVMAMIILAVVAWKARGGHYNAVNHAGVETAASFWHMVDLIWIILFILVYVLH